MLYKCCPQWYDFCKKESVSYSKHSTLNELSAEPLSTMWVTNCEKLIHFVKTVLQTGATVQYILDNTWSEISHHFTPFEVGLKPLFFFLLQYMLDYLCSDYSVYGLFLHIFLLNWITFIFIEPCHIQVPVNLSTFYLPPILPVCISTVCFMMHSHSAHCCWRMWWVWEKEK
jgi:hypothetical protein